MPRKPHVERARELRREMTPAEAILWKELRDRRFAGFKFRRQRPVGPFFADFLCHACRLIVELDGESHVGKETADDRRTRQLERMGFEVLRFWNHEVYDEKEAVMDTVYFACERRQPRSPEPKPAPPTPLPAPRERGARTGGPAPMTPAAIALAVLLADATTPAANRPVIFEPLSNGYRVILNRDAAERLRTALDNVQDEKQLAAQVRDAAKQYPPAADGTPDPTAARLELLAVGLTAYLPQLKVALRDKVGPNGATVRVFGLVKEPPPARRPRLRRVAEMAKGALPPDLQTQVNGALLLTRTTPLTIAVEPRP